MRNHNNTNNTDSIEVLKTKRKLNQDKLNSTNFKWWHWVVSGLIGGLVIYVINITLTNSVSFERNLPYIILGSIAGLFIYGCIMTLLRGIIKSTHRRIELELVQLRAEELQENIEDHFFTKLVQINFKYLDQYYLQTQEQAHKSFILASYASIAGLLVMIVGIVMMFFGKTESAYVTTGAGVISELIAALFFYLYNRTILKMSHYHQKLVITQNISLALKISEDIEGDSKIKVQEMLIDRLTTDTNKYLSIQ